MELWVVLVRLLVAGGLAGGLSGCNPLIIGAALLCSGLLTYSDLHPGVPGGGVRKNVPSAIVALLAIGLLVAIAAHVPYAMLALQIFGIAFMANLAVSVLVSVFRR